MYEETKVEFQKSRITKKFMIFGIFELHKKFKNGKSYRKGDCGMENTRSSQVYWSIVDL